MTKNINKKLAAVISDGLSVGKTGFNNFHKYKYVTEADVVEAVRKAFIKHGLIYQFSMEDVVQLTPELCRSKIKFTIIDVDSGEQYESIVFGDGQDKGDKAVYKSITGAQKYFLLKTLLIATGDDAEADESVDARAAAPATKFAVETSTSGMVHQAAAPSTPTGVVAPKSNSWRKKVTPTPLANGHAPATKADEY